MANKNNKRKNSSNKKKVHEKKVLDGVDINKKNSKNFDQIIKDIRNDDIKLEFEKGKKQKNIIEEKKVNENINEKIQSFISILFTIIIFILLVFIIFVIYNNYIKKDDKINTSEVCKDYIKKDYNIKENDILDYIKENRNIIYNISNFNIDNTTNDDLLSFSKFIIWNSDSEYLYCEESEINCLDTKKEMTYDELINNLSNYFDIEKINIIFPTIFDDKDTIRIYKEDDNVILTFKKMEYTTLKHDIVDVRIDEDNIDIIFALSKKIDNIYSYTGSKKLSLKFNNDNFKINKIVTNISN